VKLRVAGIICNAIQRVPVVQNGQRTPSLSTYCFACCSVSSIVIPFHQLPKAATASRCDQLCTSSASTFMGVAFAIVLILSGQGGVQTVLVVRSRYSRTVNAVVR